MRKTIKHPRLLAGLLVASTLASPLTMLIFLLANPFFYVAFALMPILTFPAMFCFFVCSILLFRVKQKSIAATVIILVCNSFLILWHLTYCIHGLIKYGFYIFGFSGDLITNLLYFTSLVFVMLHVLAIYRFILQRKAEKNKDKTLEDFIDEKD